MAFTAFDEHKMVAALVALMFLMAARSFPEPAGLLRQFFEHPIFRLMFQCFVAYWAAGDVKYAAGGVVLFNVANNVLRSPEERKTAPIF
jgi:hypothetical protein